MKRVVIVGASSGLGYAMAETLARGGVKVGLAARRTQSLKELKEKYPESVEYVEMDITHPSAAARLDELIAKTGGMDIYFHAAGIGMENGEFDVEKEVETAKVNALGFVRMTTLAYRYFREQGRKGQIAAITSVAGTKGMGRLAAYSASKKFDAWYLDALEQRAHIENVDICFTDIRPGWVRTPLLAAQAPHPMEMTVEYVLPQMLRAVVRRKRVAVIDWRYNLLVGAWRLIPNALWVRMDVEL